MHGYLAFDADGELLTPFRTWRNTNTGPGGRAAAARSSAYNIPHRWSVAHLYQAILDGEDARRPDRPPDHAGRLRALAAHRRAGPRHRRRQRHVPDRRRDRRLRRHDARPVRPAGRRGRGRADAGRPAARHRGRRPSRPARSPRRARGCSTRPGGCARASRCARRRATPAPGMVATNSVAPRTGNVSAGTSIFAMVVLERRARPGAPRAGPGHHAGRRPGGDGALQQRRQRARRLGRAVRRVRPRAGRRRRRRRRSSRRCSRAALDGARDCGGLLAYNYLSGEPITGLEEGRPLFLRSPGQPARPGHLHAHPAVRRPWPRCGSAWTSCRRPRACGWTGCSPTAACSRPRASRSASWPPRSTPRSPSATSPPRGAPGASPCWPPSPPRRAGPEPGRLPGRRRSSPAPTCRRRARPGRRRRLRRVPAALRRRPPGRAGRRRPRASVHRGADGMTAPDRARHATERSASTSPRCTPS